MLFQRNKRPEIHVDLVQKSGPSSLELYISEYKQVSEKITSLSLKFAGGSYLLPASLIIGAASLTFDNIYVNVVATLFPIVLFLFVYNHLRYMALQFKLSGYARFLEEKINESVSQDNPILLWESKIARENKQNGFEGFFLGTAYILIFALVLFLAYRGLYTTWLTSNLPPLVVLNISALYYYMIAAIMFFLVFFTNENKRTYELSKTVNLINQEKHPNKRIKIFVLVVIILLTPLSLYPLVRFPQKQPMIQEIDIDSYDYVVVLGNKSSNNLPSEDMKSRLDCLLKWINQSDKTTIVLSGGNGEAQIMETYLRQHNLSQKIEIEDKSTTTFENFKNIKQMVSGKILVITSDYHIFRSSILSYKVGITCDYLPAESNHSTILSSLKECLFSFYECLVN